VRQNSNGGGVGTLPRPEFGGITCGRIGARGLAESGLELREALGRSNRSAVAPASHDRDWHPRRGAAVVQEGIALMQVSDASRTCHDSIEVAEAGDTQAIVASSKKNRVIVIVPIMDRCAR